MKLVVIGAGSTYTPEVFDELIKHHSSLPIDDVALVDVDEGMERAGIIKDFGERMFKNAGIKIKLSLTTDRKKALEGADFVISQIRVGFSKARIIDEVTSMSLGLLGQETTGSGGFMNALRTIPVSLEIAADMERICPNAWLVNFTNPAGLVTEALTRFSNVKCVGLCNVPINMQADAAKVLNVERDKLHCSFVGLNHLSFMTGADLNGESRFPEVLDQISNNETLMKNIPKVPGVGDLIRTLGIIPSPYLQYYYFASVMQEKQRKTYETEGVTRGMQVEEINKQLYNLYADESLVTPPPELTQRGGSLYSYAALQIIEALTKETPTELVLNTTNNGALNGIPDDSVVEINAMVSRNGIQPVKGLYIPDTVIGLVKTVKQYGRLTAEAAVTHNPILATEALMNHPLVMEYTKSKAVTSVAEEKFPNYISWNRENG